MKLKVKQGESEKSITLFEEYYQKYPEEAGKTFNDVKVKDLIHLHSGHKDVTEISIPFNINEDIPNSLLELI